MKRVVLQDFLMEKQEPFHLSRYIQERRFQIKRTSKDHPLSSLRSGLSSSCSVGSSPIASLNVSSSATRRSSPAAMVLHVPPTTADLLLKAALRIHKPTQAKTKARRTLLGMVGSLVKMANLKKGKRDEICRQYSMEKGEDEDKESPLGSLSFTLKSHVGSESENIKDDDDFRVYNDEHRFSESPFRVFLANSHPSSRSTKFSSPTASPCRSSEELINEREREREKGTSHGKEESTSITEGGEKERNSPISVLDPPFDDEDDVDHDYDLVCSYAIVKRSRSLLMRKLRKFEKLAGVELEKHTEEDASDGSVSSSESEEGSRKAINDFIVKELKMTVVPRDIRRLIDDAMKEEQKEATVEYDSALMAEMVCKSLVSWKNAKYETIEKMVAVEMGWDKLEWKGLGGNFEKVSLLMEVDIFGFLLDELWLDLVQ